MKLKVMLMGVLLLSSNALLAQAIKDGRYALINRNSNLALDVVGVDKKNGALLQQWGYANGSNQQFDVSHQGDGYYSVKAVHSGKVLDVMSISLDLGAPIQQYTWANQANQLWHIASIDTGYYILTAKHSGQALEVWQNSKVNGGEIRQYRLTNNPNQQWKFQAVSSGSSSSSPAATASDCNSITNQPILRVAADGSGQYKTVQAALNAISASNSTPTQIRIKPGTYREKLNITKSNITFCGETGKESSTILTYGDGASTSNGSGGTIGTSGSASVTIKANDISVENITIANSFGVGSQAVALLAQGQRLQFRNCRLLGNQDTLYAHSGTQYYRNCYIQGTVDFIFGGATAVFDNNTIHSVGGGSALTAPSTEQAQPFGLVFLGGKVTAASSVSKGSVALGRNWRPYGAAAYIRTELGQHISAVGWVKMGENTLDTARFSEYLTKGAGANTSARASQSKQLTAAQASTYTISNIFGAWTPSYSK